MAIDGLSLALASGTNKNTLSLISSSFDFALVKFDAPPEYAGLGKALSPKRKKEAEDGRFHTVARKLAMLFADELPDIPQLVRTYGIRTSEIARVPSVNPKGTTRDGVFKDLVGLDGTTVWAAATSGKGAVAMHLLACMLARIWKAPQAIAIWEELVEVRKSILNDKFHHEAFHINDANAAKILVDREQLAEWDGSARAWLESGDMAFTKMQTQVGLIIDNMGLEMKTGNNVYEIVIEAWTGAMSFMENIVSGMPQTVNSAEVLLALSAWHLYPDMLVLKGGTQIVKQGDMLIPTGGVVTLGLHNQTGANNLGIMWSLPLSHLRHYGKPVVSSGEVSLSTSRISIQQLGFVVLGCVIAGWTNASTPLESCFRLFPALHSALGVSKVFPGLSQLSKIATSILASTGENRMNAERLVALGGRRCRSFLTERKVPLPQAFSLTDPNVYLTCIDGIEAKIQWLREKFGSESVMRDHSERGLALGDAFIRYVPSQDEYPYVQTRDILLPDESDGHDFRHYPLESIFRRTTQGYEFASLFRCNSENNVEGLYRRWLCVEAPQSSAKREDKELMPLKHWPKYTIELSPQLISEMPGETIQHHVYELSAGKPVKGEIENDSSAIHGIENQDYQLLSVSRSDAERFLQLEACTKERCDLIVNRMMSLIGVRDHPSTLSLINPFELAPCVPVQGALLSEPTIQRSLAPPVIPRASQESDSRQGIISTPKSLTNAPMGRVAPCTVLVGTGAYLPAPGYGTVGQSSSKRSHRLKVEIDRQRNILASEMARMESEKQAQIMEPEVQKPTEISSTDVEDLSLQSIGEEKPPLFWDCSGLESDCPYLWYAVNSLEERSRVCQYKPLIGGAASVAVYSRCETGSVPDDPFNSKAGASVLAPLSIPELLEALDNKQLDAGSIASHFTHFWAEFDQYRQSLQALETVADIYADVEDALVDLRITSMPLHKFQWVHRQQEALEHARSLACVAALESGALDVNPLDLKDVFGLSSGNSIFVASHYWTDPWESPPRGTIRRIVGNVGKPGMAFLVSLSDPETKDVDIANWKVVAHASFDGRIEDNFKDTSAHLTFTGYEQTLNTGEHGLLTREAFFLQAVVRAYDRGQWVTDLNIIGAMNDLVGKDYLFRLPNDLRDLNEGTQNLIGLHEASTCGDNLPRKPSQFCSHTRREASDYSPLMPLTSIDRWAEFLDPPSNMCIVRAAGNWLARLCFTVVALQQLRHVIVLSGNEVCWACVANVRCVRERAVVIC